MSWERIKRLWELAKDISEHLTAVLLIEAAFAAAGRYGAWLYESDPNTLNMIHTLEWWLLLILLLYLGFRLIKTLFERDFLGRNEHAALAY